MCGPLARNSRNGNIDLQRSYNGSDPWQFHVTGPQFLTVFCSRFPVSRNTYIMFSGFYHLLRSSILDPLIMANQHKQSFQVAPIDLNSPTVVCRDVSAMDIKPNFGYFWIDHFTSIVSPMKQSPSMQI